MNPSPSNEETLFQSAARLTGMERTALLDGACHGDPDLRQRLDARLSALEEAATIRSDPTQVTAPTIKLDFENAAGQSAQSSLAGTTIAGRYTLVEMLGEGGMGEVWVASQSEPVKRKVALKLIRTGMDSRAVVQRFDQERQALALMDHPNIAKVLDGGLTSARQPFFVMELVDGLPLNRFCDEARLSPRERLELFVPICQAVQHAHQKGLVHRDLKPANILVARFDGRPVPKVIDFGVAKATEGRLTEVSMATQLGAVIGTLEYMAPEQAGGEAVDTRADIYALGVILYELLTGLKPISAHRRQKAALSEMLRMVQEEDPLKPSTRLSTEGGLPELAALRQTEPRKLMTLLRGDLDWVVMKCLEKQRERRYESANGLARDIQRYLADEPVEARPPSAGYRLQKAFRRNRLAFLATAAVAVALVGGIVASWREAARANREAGRAVTAEQQATARAKAERAAREEAEAVTTFLGEVFKSPDPARDGRTITVAETLDKAARRLDSDLASQPARTAQLRAALAKTYYALGLYRDAIPLQEQVRDYHRTNSGEEHSDTLKAMHGLATSYDLAGRRPEALKLREEVLALRRTVSGPEHSDTLQAMGGLAISYSGAGRWDEALKLQETVLTLRRKTAGPENPETLSLMHNLANFYDAVDRRDEALRLREEVLTLRRKVNGPEHPDTLKAMHNLANSHDSANRSDEALRLREEVLTLRRKVLGPDHGDTLGSITVLANSYAAAGRRDEALRLREELVALAPRRYGPDHPETMRAMSNLADSYAAVGRETEALGLHEERLAASRRVNGPEHPDTVMATMHIAAFHAAAGRQNDAIGVWTQIWNTARDGNNAKEAYQSEAMEEIAIRQVWAGMDTGYEATRRKALEWAADTRQATVASRAARAAVLQPSANADLLAKALALARRAAELDARSPSARLSLGLAEYRSGHYPEADRELAVAELAPNGRIGIAVSARFFHAMSLFRQRRPGEARTLFREAEGQMDPLPPDAGRPTVGGKPAAAAQLAQWLAYGEAGALLNGPAPSP